MRPLIAVLALLALLATLSGVTPAMANESKAGPAAPAVLRFKALLVPVVEQGQVKRYANYEVSLELADASKLPLSPAQTARLQDAIISALYDGVERGWITNGAITNPTAVRQSLDAAGQAQIGKDSITRVLIIPGARQ